MNLRSGGDDPIKRIAVGKIERERQTGDFRTDRNYPKALRNFRQQDLKPTGILDSALRTEVRNLKKHHVGNDKVRSASRGDELARAFTESVVVRKTPEDRVSV